VDERRISKVAGVVAIVLSVLAAAWLAFWPCFYQGSSVKVNAQTGTTTTRTFCTSLIAENGMRVALYLAIPILITTVAVILARAGQRRPALALAFLFLGLCVLGAFSIGLFFVPAALVLLVAALTARTPAPAPA